MQTQELAGKVAIVTGGAGGIGRASCETLAAEGASVVVADVDADAGKDVADTIGSAAAFKQTDVSDLEQVHALVDFAVESIHKGMARNAAIIDAGQKRARPIIMTSIAMAAGMAPSALGIGAGGEFRSPMAIAVIGGILVSTLLSLLFVPAFFTVIDDLGALCARWFSRVIGPAEEAEPAHAPPSAVKPPEPVAKKAEKGEEMREPDVVHPA